MEHLKRWPLILLSSGLVLILLITFLTILPAFAQGPGGMMPGFGFNNGPSDGYGPGWMHGGFGPGGMMGRGFAPRWGYSEEDADSPAYGYGCPGMGGIGRWGSNSPFFDTEPLSLDEASQAVNSFLTEFNEANLELGEVMIFDNHAYAQITEKDSGLGAMEVLVDPATKAVYPEMGPNMMWNVKYGMMAGYGSYGSGGRFGWQRNEASAEMTVTPAEAVETAQSYLEAYVGDNLTADEHADPFYGYYTLHVNRDGETIGMLSVNGYTGQVFLHTWHGNLMEMSGE